MTCRVPVARGLTVLYKKSEDPTSFFTFYLELPRERDKKVLLVLSQISSNSLLLNAVPFACKLFLLSHFTSVHLSFRSVDF